MSTVPTNPDELRGKITEIDDQVLALTRQRSELTRALALTQPAPTGAGAAVGGVGSVAFLGPAASFAHQAVLARFGDVAEAVGEVWSGLAEAEPEADFSAVLRFTRGLSE